MLTTMLFFILALLLLVTVHEYGHFQVARWCGVKVLRFSFGFGKVLAKWHDRKGTEYAFSLLPLGGYVKMLDETEGEVAEDEKHLAFNNQSVLVKTAIVVAGPLFNFLFAFVALWLVAVIGINALAPIVDSIEVNSIAAQAGLTPKQEVMSLNDVKINSWHDFQYAMMPMIGSEETIDLTLRSLSDGHLSHVYMSLKNWQLDDKKPDLLKSLGIKPFMPTIPPIVGEVVPDSPAAKAGLQIGDKLLSVDGQSSDDWLFFVDYIRQHPATKLTLKINRNGTTQEIQAFSASQQSNGRVTGLLGMRSEKANWPANWLRLERKGPIAALGLALKQTWELSEATAVLMGRLVTGKLGLKNISGPVGIAKGAGDSGRSGLVSYLFFLSIMSISLGVLNLLPIPMLDGGHLLYYALELVKGKPLSERAKSIGMYFGLILLAALMLIALANDISRLVN